ncbi:Squamous cell carcinoma antigen recognized by T-cells 3 [Auxenochlorella protothecoides]|uniref:Squamous cell carcinoma antigen recognized by T-cells 3 n=1 Tax=Auxenochlorella protothecoides TaxID=3075 RepID=A0A087S9R6_AUXPR|nr:Squamous cell carcinoma antigen recognized by T-cells 3 [Auxenochlorella protothecoides]KFM22470.1 Squamous cell carcinoma antigen recognized by T-cells 3 [Auxenochlorella protothecoides]
MPNDEPMAEASSSQSDSEESDGGEIDISEQDASAIMTAEAALESNPYDYEGHANYISHVRRCGLQAKLKDAREAMHSLFPLGEGIWLEWLKDEVAAFESGSATREDVTRLHELAVQDYLSVNIWLSYLAFISSGVQSGDSAAISEVRDVFERALTATSLHFSQGARVWAAYRQFEARLVAPQEETSTASAQQPTEKVLALFRRQLAVPHAHSGATLAEWEHAGGAEDPRRKEVLAAHEAAMRSAGEREPFEAAIGEEGAAADIQLLGGYMSYLEFEKKKGDLARCQCLYERVLAVFPVTHFLWLQYCSFLESRLLRQQDVNRLITSAYARATRNCPWVGQLWERRIRALHRAGAAEGELAAVYGEALAAHVPVREDVVRVVLAYAHYFKCKKELSQLQSLLTEAEKHLETRFQGELDHSLALPTFWAEAEAQLSEPAAAGEEHSGATPGWQVWEAVLRSPLGWRRRAWAAAISFELRHGGPEKARKLYQRCHRRKLEDGGQARLLQDWLVFEGLFGDAQSYAEACTQADPILSELASAAAARAQADAEAAHASGAAAPRSARTAKPAAGKAPPILDPEEQKARRQAADPNFKPREKRAPSEAAAGDETKPPHPKRPRQAEQGNAEGGIAVDVASAKEDIQSDSRTAGKEAPLAEKATEPAPTFTAFVKHLAPVVGREQLEELFSGCGGIAEIRFGINPSTKKSKGFAYVEFKTEAGLKAACALDRTDFHGKHIFIAPSNKPKPSAGHDVPDKAPAGGGRANQAPDPLDAEAAPVAPASTTMKPRAAFMPRAARLGSQAKPGPPKSNSDFRAMLLEPKT